MYHRKWCKETVIALKQSKPIQPYCLFLSGSSGVGKTHVIKLIHTDTVKLLQCAHQITAEDVPILLTASTGVAAHNISGMTIHSAFMLNDRTSNYLTYYCLGADTLNTLQLHLVQLMVVINIIQDTYAPSGNKGTKLLRYMLWKCYNHSSWRPLPTSTIKR